MSFYKTGQITMGNMSNFTARYDMPTKQLEDGSIWRRIHWLDLTAEKTVFASETEVAECIDKGNRYSRMGIVDNFKSNTVSLTNMLPQIDGTTGFSSSFMTSGTEYYKYGKPSLKITATASNREATATSVGEYHLIPDHTYYARVEILQEAKVGGAGMYWPVAEPYFFSAQPISTVKNWTIVSTVKDRPSSDSDFAEEKNKPFRLDFDNGNVAGNMWFSGVMLIDLTASFGAGKEPTKDWLDANIPYFTGTKKFNFIDLDNGKYEFMLIYPRLSTTQYNRWKQSISPNSSYVTSAAGTGYEAIHTDFTNYAAPITKSNSSASSVYSCNYSANWWAPIGQLTLYSSTGIPAANGSTQTETELWVRVDLLGENQNIEIYKQDNIIAYEFIEY